MRGGFHRNWHGREQDGSSSKHNRTTDNNRLIHSNGSRIDSGSSGHLICGFNLGTHVCQWRSNSDISLKLHRADRHLILPEGGKAELERIDPILEEERKEKARRARKRTADDEAEERAK